MTPSWIPDEATIDAANVTGLMADLGLADLAALHRWSVEDRDAFWSTVVDRLGIVFAVAPRAVRASDDPRRPGWFPGARMNIVESCWRGSPDRLAVVHRRGGTVVRTSLAELREAAMRFAAGVVARGWEPGTRVAIAMPMNLEAVVAYLGIVAAGGVVVSIADSFAPDEIATRLRITDPVAVVTQDVVRRGGKLLPMYDKVVAAGAPEAIVVDTGAGVELRRGDRPYDAFPAAEPLPAAVVVEPGHPSNILFSSGTTGEPKAIPWDHTTPIKAAMDGRYHQDIHAEEVVAWPTNLGWMMGPWLIYAALLNGAAFALYDDVPTGRGFCEFVVEAGVNVLGVVPSIVAAWRAGDALDGLDWSGVRVLSSTGEASRPDDYAWLMERVGAPVIEYCGGTEIGGGYISATVVEPAVPSTFTMPTLGWDLRILDEDGRPTDEGEVFLVPPSIGMSVELLNRDHDAVYYGGLPAADVPLRRHGDRMRRLPDGRYRAEGRVDDTMNLGGIKVSSAEIERVVGGVEGVGEVAAVAVPPPGGGPERLVLFVVPHGTVAADDLRAAMQARIRTALNPLFKIDRVVLVDALPRTASQKVMRRELRRRLTG